MFVISPCFTLQAYLYSSASRILGVELDRSFCDLQERIVQKYNMADRVKVGAYTNTENLPSYYDYFMQWLWVWLKDYKNMKN